MSKIQITTDSVSDLSPELMEQHNIKMLPLLINMGEVSEPDGEGMPAKIFAFVEKTGKLPKTAARGIEEYIAFFTEHKPKNGELVHFCISRKMSAGYEMATAAAKELEGVYIVDTESLSTGSGLSVLYACDLADEGKLTGKEIYEACQARAKNAQASFVLDSLSFLHKGGRCSGLTMFVASILKIKPMICLNDGEMKVGKKYMARFDAAVEKYVNDILNTYATPDLKRCFITHTPLPEGMAEKVKETVLKRYPFENIYITEAGGTITSHCGKNTIGVLYFNDGVKA